MGGLALVRGARFLGSGPGQYGTMAFAMASLLGVD